MYIFKRGKRPRINGILVKTIEAIRLFSKEFISFFQNVSNPFGNQEIPYVLTKATRSNSRLLWNGKESKKHENKLPLQFVFSDREGIDKKQNISELEEKIEDSVCLEIARLLHLSKKGILQYDSSVQSSEPLLSHVQPKQIAILVRRTEEGRRMRNRLQAEGIPSVLCAEEKYLSDSRSRGFGNYFKLYCRGKHSTCQRSSKYLNMGERSLSNTRNFQLCKRKAGNYGTFPTLC